MSNSNQKNSQQPSSNSNKKINAPIDPIAKQVRFCDSVHFSEEKYGVALSSENPKNNNTKEDNK